MNPALAIADLDIPERPRAVVAEIATEVKRRLGDDVELIWYGSWVKGTARPQSDLDLAVRRATPIAHSDMVALREWVDDLRTLYSVDLLDLTEVGATLRERIEQEGIAL